MIPEVKVIRDITSQSLIHDTASPSLIHDITSQSLILDVTSQSLIDDITSQSLNHDITSQSLNHDITSQSLIHRSFHTFISLFFPPPIFSPEEDRKKRRWMNREDRNYKGRIPASRGIMQSCILAFSRPKREKLWWLRSLNRRGIDFRFRDNDSRTKSRGIEILHSTREFTALEGRQNYLSLSSLCLSWFFSLKFLIFFLLKLSVSLFVVFVLISFSSCQNRFAHHPFLPSFIPFIHLPVCMIHSFTNSRCIRHTHTKKNRLPGGCKVLSKVPCFQAWSTRISPWSDLNGLTSRWNLASQ